MFITKDSQQTFIRLSKNIDDVRYGQLLIIKHNNILNHLKMFPNVLSIVVNEYYDTLYIIDYELRKVYQHGMFRTRLNFRCYDLGFFHRLEYNYYIHDIQLDFNPFLSYAYYNDNISCPTNDLKNNYINLGSFFDYILKQQNKWYSRLTYKPVFELKDKYDYKRTKNIVCITQSICKYHLNIVNYDKLIACVRVCETIINFINSLHTQITF